MYVQSTIISPIMDANLDSLHVFGFNLKILNKIMQKKLPGKIAQKVTPCIISLTHY